MAKKTVTKKTTNNLATLKKQLAQYEEVFGEVQHFTDLIHQQDAEVVEAHAAMLEAKAKYEDAKSSLAECRDARDGTKHALFMFLKPGPAEILPLFDRMEPADEEKHGAHSDEWRKEPISALRLSLIATNLLTAADVMFVGQLQDRMQDSPDDWWEKIEGLSQAVAMAIADQLTEFINDRTGK